MTTKISLTTNRFFYNYLCESCFTCEEDFICEECAKNANMCMNCVYYGDMNEPLCVNCREIGDEGYCCEEDLMRLFLWMEFNHSYFLDECHIR